jgi:transposase
VAHGHDVRLMPPEYVRPYVKAQNNDDRDAEGIAEQLRAILLERGIVVPKGIGLGMRGNLVVNA